MRVKVRPTTTTTTPVTRAIGVSRAVCTVEFRRNSRSHSHLHVFYKTKKNNDLVDFDALCGRSSDCCDRHVRWWFALRAHGLRRRVNNRPKNGLDSIFCYFGVFSLVNHDYLIICLAWRLVLHTKKQHVYFFVVLRMTMLKPIRCVRTLKDMLFRFIVYILLIKDRLILICLIWICLGL